MFDIQIFKDWQIGLVSMFSISRYAIPAVKEKKGR